MAVPLATRLGAALLSRDHVVGEIDHPLAALDRLVARIFGFRRPAFQDRANRLLLSAVAAELSRGRSVVVEVVADGDLRQRLQCAATEHGAQLCPVEVVCRDEAEHRRRLSERGGRWGTVLHRTSSRYRPPPDALVLGSHLAPAVLVEQAAEFVQRMAL